MAEEEEQTEEEEVEGVFKDDELYLLGKEYGNFDIIVDHFSCISRLCTVTRAPGDRLYFMPVLIGC